MESSTIRQLTNLVGIVTSTGLEIVILENQFLDIVFQWVLTVSWTSKKTTTYGTIFNGSGIQSSMHSGMRGSLAKKSIYGCGGSNKDNNGIEM